MTPETQFLQQKSRIKGGLSNKQEGKTKNQGYP